MNFYKILSYFFFIFIFSQGVLSQIAIKSHFNPYLAEVVREIANQRVHNSIKTQNIIASGKNQSIQEFLETFLIISSEDLTSKFRHSTVDRVSILGAGSTRRNNIFIAEDFQGFLKIYETISNENFFLQGTFSIALVKGEIPEIHEIFKLLWEKQIFKVNVVHEIESGEILVKTFMPFNPKSCSDTTPVIISRFKNGKFSSKNFFPKKVNNLHNCSIRVAVTSFSEPYVFVKKSESGFDFTGLDVNLIKTLSESLNFYANFNYIEDIGYILENGSAAGSFGLLKNFETDLVISGWMLKASRVKFFDASTSYGSDNMIFVVPPGRDYTSLEKLIYPFESSLWIGVGICFFFGVFIIAVIKTQSKSVQKFVFGSFVTQPFLNLFAGCVGVPQYKLPGRNFARFLLMMFFMYSMVIRTIYQASYYHLLSSNSYHKEVQSIDEMIEKNFVFYVGFGTKDMVDYNEEIWKRLDFTKSVFLILCFKVLKSQN